ncbi:MAG: hypothetical protein ACYC59_07250 [Anaerolineaceae bacterium]|jgi:hypothetical protein
MMKHFYLSLLPEALIVSMLTPEEFGVYYAVGSLKKSRGQAIFFEIDPDFRSDEFQIEEAIKRCNPHEDGTPKRSIYVSVYRVLERIPLKALQKLYLVTQDGRTLGVEKSTQLPKTEEGMHLYREITPVNPLVASTLDPKAFYELIVRNPTSLIKLPAICFAELKLGALADDPQNGDIGDLPYDNSFHIRDCLLELRTKFVHSKMVDRTPSGGLPYRTIKNGFFVGNEKELVYYPIPGQEELMEKHYSWWRSASF